MAISAVGWLRIAWRLLALATLLVVCATLHYIWRPFTDHSPWPRRFFKLVAMIVGLRVAPGGENVKQGVFFVANHVSWLDSPAICSLTGSAFVGHDGLASHPVMHWLCRLNDTVLIARHDRTSVTRQIEQVKQALRETGALTVFPEGTTNDGTHVPPFKSSLLSALSPLPEGISVQPVWLDYGKRPQDIAWVGDESGIANFLKVTARSEPIALTVHFLPALSGEALESRKTIAAAARDAIIAAKLRQDEGRS